MNFCDSASHNQGLKLALAQLRGSAVVAMPFTEDDMFSPWSPSNDGRIVGDFQCIQVNQILISQDFMSLIFSRCANFQDMSENNMNQQQPQSQMQQAQQPQSTQQQNNQNQDLVNCDLANLESLSCNDSDELLRQLTENTFELETFFSEFSTADIKVGENKSDFIRKQN